MKEYKRIIVPRCSVFDLFSEIHSRATHAEAVSYVWFLNPKNSKFYRLKDDDFNYFMKYHEELKIHLIRGRPVIYDDKIPIDEIIFRAYLP